MAFVIGKESPIGTSISTAEAESYIFGLVLFNDWSARDIQKWEYVPLGPFLGKSFASSISPWVVPIEALDPFRVPGPEQDPSVLPYLEYEGAKNYDIHLEVAFLPKEKQRPLLHDRISAICTGIWRQQLAHHTVNGCNVRVGDMMASGTISGTEPDSYGSMLELSWAGSTPISLENGDTRTFIEDFDTVVMRGYAEKDGVRVGFGEVLGQVLPAGA